MFAHARQFFVESLTLILAVLLALPAAFAAEGNRPMQLTDAVRSVARSNNEFAFDLYGQLSAAESGNLFFSPASISTALAMVYAGAEGETEDEMAAALKLDVPEKQVHAAFDSLMTALNAPEQERYELRIANRLWGQAGYDFLPTYLETTRESYGAELAQVDFGKNTEQVRGTINAWIERQTNDKIEELIPRGSLSALTRLVLTNAIYFKGTWEHEFDKDATQDAAFRVSADDRIDVPLMFQKRRFRYGETKDLQLLEMAYKGGDLSMLVLLPKQKDNALPAIEENLSAESLSAWTSRMRMQEVRVYLPRFELTKEFQLNSMLSALGMPSAFEPGRADFSGMNGRKDLYISAALHKAFVDVNEEGTEAAAATGVVVGVTAVAPEPKVFRADHPFVFVIRHGGTGSILFMGRINNPEE